MMSAMPQADPSGHDTSSEPAALDLVHVRGQTRAALPGVGAARRHLPHALAAPDGASGGTDRGARGRGVGGSDGAGFGLVVFGGVACGRCWACGIRWLTSTRRGTGAW